jgi:hypothetical protein
MSLRRLAVGLLTVSAAALAAALPATGKEGVKATLTTTIPLDAPAGTSIKVAWTLAGVDENGRRYRFGASGVFVRLVSRSGAPATTGYAPSGGPETGEYAATVVAPEGGIADVRIGLRGFTSGATGYRQSDMLFPITNDPMPGAAKVAAAPSAPSSGSTRWIVIISAGVLCALALAVAAFTAAKRKNASGELRVTSPS